MMSNLPKVWLAHSYTLNKNILLENKESEAVIWLIVKQVFADLDQAKKTKFTDEYNRFSQFSEA
jgi:hypothetical protein